MRVRIRPSVVSLLLACTALVQATLAAPAAGSQDFNVYVTDFGGTGGVVEFDGATSAFVKCFAQGSRGGGLAVDGANYFYYGNVDNHSVDLYDPQGNFIQTFAMLRGEARGVVFGSDGNLYASDYGANSVEVFDGQTGEYLGDFVATGSGDLSGSNGLAFGPDGSLYVASEFNGKILQYDPPVATGQNVIHFQHD